MAKLPCMYSVPVPPELVLDAKLSPQARFAAIVVRAVSEHDRTNRTEAELTALCGFRSRRTLRRHLRALAAAGWIEIRPGADRRRRVYIFHDLAAERLLADLQALRRRIAESPYLGEALAIEWIRLFVTADDLTMRARPDFLINPMTGQRMEYDVWFPRERVAFEFNGTAHDRPMEDDLDGTRWQWQRTLELTKRSLSDDMGVRLVIIRTQDLSYGRMRELVGSVLPTRDVPPDHPAAVLLTRLSAEYMARQRQR